MVNWKEGDYNINIDKFGRDDFGYFTTISSFALSTSTPFLLVTKEVSIDVTRLLESYKQLLASTMCLQRITSPSQDFLDIVARSRFAFDAGPLAAAFLLKHLPDSVRPTIHLCHVLCAYCVYHVLAFQCN